MRPLIGALFVGAAFVFSPARAPAQDEQQAEGSWPSLRHDRTARIFGSLSMGRGLRLNNPYRLETELGDDAESLSLTATYLDLGLGAVMGDPHGLSHGAVTELSIAVEGIAQEVASLSYLVLLSLGRDGLGFARAGVPVVLEPDLGAGLELGVGGAWLFTGGLGVCTELVSSLFFGAATWESDPTLVPVIALELGVFVEYEALP